MSHKRPDLVEFNKTCDRSGPRPWMRKPKEQLSPFRKKALGLIMTEDEFKVLKDYYANWAIKDRTTASGKARSLCGSARTFATRNHLDFDLTQEWVQEKIDRGVCEVSGMPFDMKRKGPFVPSLDRKVPGGPYTQENVQVVVWLYNAAKQNFTHEDVMVLAEALCQQKRLA